MNGRRSVPIGWFGDASRKAQGKEPVASHWTGRLCVLTHVQLSYVNHKSLSMFTRISVILLNWSLWFDNILWVERKWMHGHTQWRSNFIYPTFYANPAVKFRTSQFSWNTVARLGMHNSLTMNYARALLQERQRLFDSRKKTVMHRPSPNQAMLHNLHVNRAELSNELREALIISRVGPRYKSVVLLLHRPFKCLNS